MTDGEFESLCHFYNIQKKVTGENPDTFPGAEGETRRVFNPSCSLCEQFILCPFLLRKKMDEEFESLCPFCNIQKKGTGKNPIPLLSVGYRKDVFMFFVDRVELSEFLMKSFALLTMKSKPTVLMKFSATQKMKLNPPIAAAISYAESVFHIAKQCFTHPQGWI